MWNDPEELAFYLNRYIELGTFNKWFNAILEINSERDKEINLQLLKSIKKAIPYLKLEDPIQFTRIVTDKIKELK